VGEHSFPSKLEAQVFQILSLEVTAGIMRDLVRQPQTRLTLAQIGYKPDFKYTSCVTGEEIFVEAKGVETESYLLKKKLWKFYGPGKLIVYKQSHRGPYIDEMIEPEVVNGGL
jgi:hypothetical protein